MGSKKNIKVDCEVMKKNWDRSQPVKTNLTNMGLAYDPNKILKAKSVKTTMIEKINQTDTGGNIPKDRKNQISKVVKSLQEESESTKPQQTFRFTKEQTNWITYLLDKYGDDFQCKNISISSSTRRWRKLRRMIIKYGQDYNVENESLS